ncbi:MAG: histone deacetylase [Desulfobacteraceae bacterium]|nr:histone deacetylase [Desulfobacteraceae bacterium]
MKRTGYLYDLRFLLHDTGPYHPECSERLLAIHRGIEAGGLLPLVKVIGAVKAEIRRIEAVHDPSYIRRFEELCLCGHRTFDFPDNQMCQETYEVALLAAGGVIEAVRQVMAGEIDNAFCAIRPPGHHAEVNQAMGFCYFNNIAIAARYLQDEWKLARIGIIDFDVHHGNGTQHIFEQDPTVLYYSCHEHPTFAFPGTGRSFEKGVGPGVGTTRNWPILPGQGDDEYRKLIETDLWPTFDAFKPEVVLVSCGFDAHEEDDMSDIRLTTGGYSYVMQQVVAIAEKYAGGRLVSVLEGGYCLARLPELARNHVQILLGEEIPG